MTIVRFALGLTIACSIFAANLPVVRADVLPPGYREAQQRMQMPGVWDREDQYCAGKKEDDDCRIPGNAFEGGGEGTCTRNLPRGARHIDLSCELDEPPAIRRDIPAGAYLAEPDTCEHIAKGRINIFKEFVCTPPPMVADRFCAKFKEGDDCQAHVSVGANGSLYPGKCLKRTETRNYYQYGYREAKRDVLLCSPVAPAPAKAFTPVGVLRKLAQ